MTGRGIGGFFGFFFLQRRVSSAEVVKKRQKKQQLHVSRGRGRVEGGAGKPRSKVHTLTRRASAIMAAIRGPGVHMTDQTRHGNQNWGRRHYIHYIPIMLATWIRA
jgi:hypothetical protein